MKQTITYYLNWFYKAWPKLIFWGGVATTIYIKALVPAYNVLIDLHESKKAEIAFQTRVNNYIHADSLLKVSMADSVLKFSRDLKKNYSLTNMVISSFKTHLQNEKMFQDVIQLQQDQIRVLQDASDSRDAIQHSFKYEKIDKK